MEMFTQEEIFAFILRSIRFDIGDDDCHCHRRNEIYL